MYQQRRNASSILRLADGAIIPADPANRDYTAYLAWRAAGNTPAAEAAPPVPVSVTPLQARKALRAAGLKAAADAFIATLAEEEREEWDYAIEVRRDNAIIAKAAAHLGLSAAAVDDLFRAAAALP